MRLLPRRVLVLLLILSGFPSLGASGDEWLGEDKAKHFAACTVLAAGGYGAGALVFEAPAARWLTGAGLAMGAGLGKELYDSRSGGTGFSTKDLVWDAAGTATGLGLAFLVDHFIFGREAPASPAVELRAVAPVVLGGRSSGASRLALDELHQLLPLEARVHRHHGAAPAVAAGDEHGDLASRALVHAAGGQDADLLGQAPLGERTLEPAGQVHPSASRASAHEALAADEHLHLLRLSTAAFVPHPSSSVWESLVPPLPSDAPLRTR
ncbi:YfiM family protein [Pyxidicoccus trucidator]|uniref:YfiM family protein n=1 Tax=Pyxidicoccus trucidator TaxID=2709662 RepID=UPI0013DB9481|nr:hypothetical protein [Pyxidicoccus trucidator]